MKAKIKVVKDREWAEQLIQKARTSELQVWYEEWDNLNYSDIETGKQKVYLSPVNWRGQFEALEADKEGMFPYGERISIPLQDWREYRRFTKSWLYKLWRSYGNKD